jgi:magnesium transporter
VPDLVTARDSSAGTTPAEREEERESEGLELPTRFRKGKPGSRPGIDLAELEKMPATARVPVSVIDYGPDRFDIRKIEDFDAFIVQRRPEWARVRWINVDGLSDPIVIRALAIKYGMHPLAIEDLMTPHQRPKVEPYEKQGERQAQLFLIVRMVQLIEGQLESEQISIFVNPNTVITFQESPGDVWDPIRQRITKPGSRMRELDASYLLYALLDAIVDHCFPVLEYYGDRLEELEEIVLERPDRQTISEVHHLKRQLLLLRRAVWPMREVVNGLQREPHECLSETTRMYLRDVYDHTIQIMDIIETYREVGSSLTETYMTSMSNRLSETMKVLTIIGTIFIPLTFLAGVYGMNMPIPENHWAGSYPVFWGVCIVSAGTMLYWFRKRGWL